MKMIMRNKQILIAFLMVFFLGFDRASAQEENYDSSHLSRDELAEILKSGDVLNLEKIIEHIEREKDDRLLEVELLNYDDILIYQIEILKANGVVLTFYLDGKTGENASHLLED